MLEINKKLFQFLEKEKIKYCHWKSNEHLEAGLDGKTDLDILIDYNKEGKVKKILSRFGFKLYKAFDFLEYPGLEHYIGIDKEKLVHLHLHWKLRLGEKHLKGYYLPWEDIIFENRRKNKIYINDHNIELILLLVRMSLKIRLRDRSFPKISKDDRKEFLWLKKRVDKKLIEFSKKLVGNEAAMILGEIVRSGLNFKILLEFRRAINLKSYKMYNPIKAHILGWTREIVWIVHKVNQMFFHLAIPTGLRARNKKGKIIVFVGCDGSGKSTVSKDIFKWLSWKFSPVFVYFGSGQGSISLLRLPIHVLSKVFYRKQRGKIVLDVYSNKKKLSLKKFGVLLWAVTLALEKKQKLKRVLKARKKGMIVICDRYPQKKVKHLNDGPLLVDWLKSKNNLIRSIARWEYNSYGLAEKNPPDIVVKLNVSSNVVLKRKNDIGEAEIKSKIKMINGLSFSCKTVNINADLPLKKVILKSRQAVWDIL